MPLAYSMWMMNLRLNLSLFVIQPMNFRNQSGYIPGLVMQAAKCAKLPVAHGPICCQVFFLGFAASFANRFRFLEKFPKLMVDVQLCLLRNLILAMIQAAKKQRTPNEQVYSNLCH